MNNCKVCVSVTAETADELVKLIRIAEKTAADVIEVRLDGLRPDEFRRAFDQLASEKTILVTIRPDSQGGKARLTLEDRISLWTSFATNGRIDHKAVWIDHEADLDSKSQFPFLAENCVTIRSQHDMEGVPDDLDKVYGLVVSDAEIGKIAVYARDITDTIGIWNLLKRAVHDGRRIIPIAMGEAGKWTRILSAAHGSHMAYASLETGSELAAGQISIRDTTEVFRVRELDAVTSVYGIVAGDTTYSVSPVMHNAAFKAAGEDAVFVPLQVTDLESFFTRMAAPKTREVELNFKGFSVTNPHKQAIIRYLDEIDDAAMRIGAVNTVKIENGMFYGSNTDAPAFIETLRDAYGALNGASVAVFGAGGAARACVYALAAEGARVTVVARNEVTGRSIADEFGAAFIPPPNGHDSLSADFDIIVNTTPLGTAGESASSTILEAPQLEGVKLVYDLVYNPAKTTLMKEAAKAGVRAMNGLEMLVAQGARQFKTWTGCDAPIDTMRAAVKERLRQNNE